MKALRDVDAVINGVSLKAGKQVEASLDDRIVFHNDSEMDLIDLRRRARAMGGRFQLKASKSEYLVSNNPSMLEADDILLSPGTSGDVLLKIFCDYDARVGTLEVISADRPIMVRETPGARDGAAGGWRHDPDRYRAVPALQFLRAHHRGRAQHHSQSRSRGSEPSLRQLRGRARWHFLRGQSRRTRLRDGRERLGQEHALEGARRPNPAERRPDSAQRPVALRQPRRPQALRQLHPAGGRVRREPDHRGKPAIRGRHSLAASFPARSDAAPREQIGRARV